MKRIEIVSGPAGNFRILFKETPIGSLLRNRVGIYTFYPMYEIRNQILLREDWDEIGLLWLQLELKEKNK